MGVPPPPAILVATDRRLERIAADGTRTTVVDAPVTCVHDGYAIVGGHSLALVDDTTAEAVAEAPSGTTLKCVAATSDGAVVGTDGGHVLRLADDRLVPVASFDELPGRRGWYTPWGDPADTRWLSAAGDEVWAAVHVGGIHRSDDGGRTWSETTFTVDDDVHQVVALGDGRAVAACAAGCAVTGDGGATWTITAAGLPVRYARGVTVAGDGGVLLGIADGPSGGQPNVVRADAPGDDFAPVDGLPQPLGGIVDTGYLAAEGDVAVAVTPAGVLLWSGDNGRTWSRYGAGDTRAAGHPTAVALAH